MCLMTAPFEYKLRIFIFVTAQPTDIGRNDKKHFGGHWLTVLVSLLYGLCDLV